MRKPRKKPAAKPKGKENPLVKPVLTRSQYIMLAGHHEPRLLSAEQQKMLMNLTPRKELFIYQVGMSILSGVDGENTRSVVMDAFLLAHFRKKCIDSDVLEDMIDRVLVKLQDDQLREKAKENPDKPITFQDLFETEDSEFFDESMTYAFDQMQLIKEEDDIDKVIIKRIESTVRKWQRTISYTAEIYQD